MRGGFVLHNRAIARRVAAGERALSRARVDGDAFLLGELHGLRVQDLAPASAISCVSSYDNVPIRRASEDDAGVGEYTRRHPSKSRRILGVERGGHRHRLGIASAVLAW